MLRYSRKSDIENERLPPELFDADSEEGKAIMSQPTSPQETGEDQPGVNANGVNASLERAMSSSVPSPINTTNATSPKSPTSPYSPTSPTAGGFKRGHSRTASLGTTMTSPSTRRRSLESTISLIHGVLEGQDRITEEDQVDGLASRLAGSTVGNSGSPGPSNAGAGTTGSSNGPRTPAR